MILGVVAREGGSKVKKVKRAMAAAGRRGLVKMAGVGMVTAWRVRVGSRAAVDGTKERAGRVLSA
ncbi:MAG: hypothetical protein OXT07_06415 [bacterium]|nr:hypothetical protein [bacterium]